MCSSDLVKLSVHLFKSFLIVISCYDCLLAHAQAILLLFSSSVSFPAQKRSKRLPYLLCNDCFFAHASMSNEFSMKNFFGSASGGFHSDRDRDAIREPIEILNSVRT